MRISYKWSVIILVVLHLVGLIGIISPLRDWVALLTPVHLLVTLGVMLFCMGSILDKQVLALVAFIFIGGYGLEVAGVHTGRIFGIYWYGPTLGPSVFGVPLIIGINWVMLTIATTDITKRYLPYYLVPLTSAVLMVSLDWLIEPIAMRLDYWNWLNHVIPFQNYKAWFSASLMFSAVLVSLKKEIISPVSTWVYGCQVVFFGVLLIYFSSPFSTLF